MGSFGRSAIACVAIAFLSACGTIQSRVVVTEVEVRRCPVSFPDRVCPDPEQTEPPTLLGLRIHWTKQQAGLVTCNATLDAWTDAWMACVDSDDAGDTN